MVQLPALEVRPANLAQAVMEGYGVGQKFRANESALASADIDLQNKRQLQIAQEEYLKGDSSALGRMMALDPSNAARLAQGNAALRSEKQAQLQQGYDLATRAYQTIQAAEPQQRQALWDAYRSFAAQSGMQIAPELQGDYSDDKLNFLNNQIQMVKPMLAASENFDLGNSFEGKSAIVLSRQILRENPNLTPDQALLTAIDRIAQSKLTYVDDGRGGRVPMPASSSFFPNNQPTPPAPNRQISPINPAPAQTPAQPDSLMPADIIDQYEAPNPSLAGQPIAEPQPSAALGGEEYVQMPVKPVSLPTEMPAQETAQEEAVRLYPNNIDLQQAHLKNKEAARADSQKAVPQLTKITSALNKVDEQLDKFKEGGLGPMYQNESLAYGVLPGLKPVTQQLRESGLIKGKKQTDRDVLDSNINALGAVLKPMVRQPGEGTWTDADQKFLMSLLPTPNGYAPAKEIVKGLRSNLAQQINQHRAIQGLPPIPEQTLNKDIPTINSRHDAAFGALPKGAKFRTADGRIGTKQ